LRQRRNRRNRFIEIQLAICGELLRALRYARNPYKRAVGQCLELAADNRLVASSSPPSLRWRLIMAWLEVRVLSAPPRSPIQTEISRCHANSAELAGFLFSGVRDTIGRASARRSRLMRLMAFANAPIRDCRGSFQL
jgi:hypothetical protein